MMALCSLPTGLRLVEAAFQTRLVASPELCNVARVGFPQHPALDPPRCRPLLWRIQNYTEIYVMARRFLAARDSASGFPGDLV